MGASNAKIHHDDAPEALARTEGAPRKPWRSFRSIGLAQEGGHAPRRAA